MNSLLSILLVAAVGFSNPSNYLFKTIPARQALKIKGELLKQGKAIRYEDYAFLNEMITERDCLTYPSQEIDAKTIFNYSGNSSITPYSGENFDPNLVVGSSGNPSGVQSLLDEVVRKTVRTIDNARDAQRGEVIRYFPKGTLPDLDEGGCVVIGSDDVPSFHTLVGVLYQSSTPVLFTNSPPVSIHYAKMTNGVPILSQRKDALEGCFGAMSLFDEIMFVYDGGELPRYATNHSKTSSGEEVTGEPRNTTSPLGGGASYYWIEDARAGYNEKVDSETTKTTAYGYEDATRFAFGVSSLKNYGSGSPHYNVIALDFVFKVEWSKKSESRFAERFSFDEFGYEVWQTVSIEPTILSTGTTYVVSQVAVSPSGDYDYVGSNVCAWTASESLFSLMNTAIEKAVGIDGFSLTAFPENDLKVPSFTLDGPTDTTQLPDMYYKRNEKRLSVNVIVSTILVEIEASPSSVVTGGGGGNIGGGSDDPSPVQNGGNQ